MKYYLLSLIISLVPFCNEPDTPQVSLSNPQLQAPAGSALASKASLTADEANLYALELSEAWK